MAYQPWTGICILSLLHFRDLQSLEGLCDNGKEYILAPLTIPVLDNIIDNVNAFEQVLNDLSSQRPPSPSFSRRKAMLLKMMFLNNKWGMLVLIVCLISNLIVTTWTSCIILTIGMSTLA